MDKSLFFAVWDLSELRQLIVSFMYPGKRSSTWYNYKKGDMAILHGYYALINERRLIYKDPLLMVFESGRYDLINKFVDRCSTYALDKAIRINYDGVRDLCVFYPKISYELMVRYIKNNGENNKNDAFALVGLGLSKVSLILEAIEYCLQDLAIKMLEIKLQQQHKEDYYEVIIEYCICYETHKVLRYMKESGIELKEKHVEYAQSIGSYSSVNFITKLGFTKKQ
jgi:hypothetical protein